MEITVKTDKKDYFLCSMFLMKKYFGLREIILLSILFVAGLFLYLFNGYILIFILFGVTCALLLFTFILFLWTSISGYKVDVVKKNVGFIKLDFQEKTVVATSLTRTGDFIFSETHFYDKLENIVIKKHKIYIYAGVAIFYYINKNELKLNEATELETLLKSGVPAAKFTFRKRIRTYPKRQKRTK